MLASLIVEDVSGMSWERFVQTRIFDVLGMKRSNFSTRITQQDPDHARPHIYRDGLLRECTFWEQDENSVTGAAGSINSCASELTTWLTLQMNVGNVGQRQFVKPETLEAMHLPSIFIDDPQARRRFGYEFSSYGMGWFLRSHKGQMLISHGGSINGFWCTQYFMPRHRLGVVALSNCDEGRNAAPVIISLTLFDRLLGLEPTDWDALMTESYAEAAAAEKKAKEELLGGRISGAQPAHPLATYVGEYEHPGYGHLSIHLRQASLQMVMNDKKTFALALAHDDIFDAHEPDWDDRLKITFIANAQGRIRSLSIPLEEAVAEIVFVRQAEVDANTTAAEVDGMKGIGYC
jgi:CubicO group peptidase (beta-lactamase class C family)